MIRMCDTTQTWKWGGFGPGRVGGEGGGERRRGLRQTDAVPPAAQPSEPRVGGDRRGVEPSRRGATGGGGDGGTAAPAPPGLGTAVL